MGDLARAGELLDDLGDIVCLTFIKGVDEAEALRRLGGYPDTIREVEPDEVGELVVESDGDLQIGVAVGLGSWSVVIEPVGFCGADHSLLEIASTGGEAISVLRHDYASASFSYAVDGTLVTGFDPHYPDPPSMHGSDPGRLWPAMRAVGFRPPDETDEADETDPPGTTAMALLLAERLTGVTLPPDPLNEPRLFAELEPWFVVPSDPGDLLFADRFTLDPHAAPLVAAVDAADPHTRRRVAVDEVRRQAAALGLADTPGLADLLHAAAEGGATPIAAGSPLGRHVRAWLSASQNARELDPEEQTHAYALGWFVGALRGVLNPDPRWAALAAVKPLTSEIRGLGDHALRARVIDALRG